jgi:hypothetical protein
MREALRAFHEAYVAYREDMNSQEAPTGFEPVYTALQAAA